MELNKFFKLVYKRKYILVIVPLITVFVTYFLVQKLPDTFKSHARLSTGIVDQASQLLTNSDISQESRTAQQFSNLLEVFHLKRVFDQVSFKLMLHDLTSNKPFRPPSKLMKQVNPSARAYAIEVFKEKLKTKEPLSLWYANQNGLNQLLISMGYDEETLQKKVLIYRVNNSDFIDVDMESENPFLSAFIVNTLCEEFLNYYENYIRSNQIRAVNFLDTLTKVKYDSMNNKMRQLRDYKIKNRILNLNEQARTLYAQITDYESRLQMANKDISSFESAIEGIDKKFDTKDRRYLESTIVAVNQAILDTRNQLQAVTDELIKSNYDARVQVKQDSLRALLEQQILQSTDKLLVSPLSNKQTLVTQRINLEVSKNLALGSVNSIKVEIERLNKKFDLLVPHEALIQNYEGAVDVAGKEYLEVLNKFNKTTYETSVGMQLHQIEAAMPSPALPSKKLLLVILSGILSFVFCIVILFVLFYLDDAIVNAQDLANKTGIPVLSFLPTINTSLLNLSSLFKGEETNRNTIAFKHLLRSLRFEVERAMSNQKMLVVTSLNNGEGKSLIAMGLAYAFSMVNKKVLLIDGNFDEPTITNISGTSFYLEDYLSNQVSIKDVMREGKVSIMGNRGGDASLFELCDETIVKPKFIYLRDVFDIIIIESPSLDRMNKSREWIVVSDMVLGVYASGKSIKPNAKQNIRFIQQLGDRFAGWALNKVFFNRLESMPK
jgi:capsular polysaccharide biosynthesis protein/Mrp family chromosome partitioning ATPase